MKQSSLKGRGKILQINIDNVCIFLVAFVGFLLAATRVFGESPDYWSYDIFFDTLRSHGIDAVLGSRFEIGFSTISLGLVEIISSNAIVYGIIVFFAISLKLLVFKGDRRVGVGFFLIVLLYFSKFFALHELTQLRAACAISLILIAAKIIWRGNYIGGGLLCLLAFMFHKSVAIVIPMIFLRPVNRASVLVIFASVFLIAKAMADFALGYFADFIQILEAYQSEGFGIARPNPFSVEIMIEWISLSIGIILWSKSTIMMRRIVVLEAVGIAIYYGCIDFPVVAHRMKEFFSVFWVLYLPDALNQRKTRLGAFVILFISTALYFYVYYLSGKFFSCGDKCSFQ